jgi:hypothetical protein
MELNQNAEREIWLDCLSRGKYYHYYKNLQDTEFPKSISWNIYGDYTKELIIVRATHHYLKDGLPKNDEYYASYKSGIFIPKMIDRRFWIDVRDCDLATTLCNKLLDKFIRDKL